MNAAQLTRFGRSIGEESVAVLRKEGGSLRYADLVRKLCDKSAMEPSEVAFGLSVATASLQILKVETLSDGRRVLPA